MDNCRATAEADKQNIFAWPSMLEQSYLTGGDFGWLIHDTHRQSTNKHIHKNCAMHCGEQNMRIKTWTKNSVEYCITMTLR